MCELSPSSVTASLYNQALAHKPDFGSGFSKTIKGTFLLLVILSGHSVFGKNISWGSYECGDYKEFLQKSRVVCLCCARCPLNRWAKRCQWTWLNSPHSSAVMPNQVVCKLWRQLSRRVLWFGDSSASLNLTVTGLIASGFRSELKRRSLWEQNLHSGSFCVFEWPPMRMKTHHNKLAGMSHRNLIFH